MADTSVPAPTPQEKPTSNQAEAAVKPRKRLHDVFIFIGAALVLTSFIVKDAIRENLKDVSDKIDKLQLLYVVKKQTTEIDQGVNDILIDVEQLTSKRQRLYNGNFLLLNIDFAQRAIDNGWDLVAECPDSPAKAALSRTMARLKTEIDNETGTRDASSGEPNGDLFWELVDFEQRALYLATERKQKIEHWYSISTRVSYVLYGIVVVFGVIARLKGIDVVGGE